MSARCLVLFALFTLVASAAAQDETVLGKKCSEWLTILKEHKETKFRRAALIALEVFGPKTRGVVDGVEEALEKDSEPAIRREAALLLGRMGADAKEAVPYLAEALKKDKSDMVREAAALSLGDKLSEYAHEQVLVLAGALTDSHAGTRAAAAAALNHFGDKARLALPQLAAIAKDKKADRLPRMYAVQILSRLQADQPETGAILIAVAGESEASVSLRVAALEGIGRLEKAGAAELQTLGQLLQDKQVELRRAAAGVLSKIGPPSASLWPQIQGRLQDDDGTVRYQLIHVAGAVAEQEKEAVPALAQVAVKDALVENRLAAIGELGQLGSIANPAAETLANLATQDARAAIREAATAALKKINSK